ncbi:sulfatase-like hydrolase/transferase [Spongiimicrobium sp. 2-473A-2-J]|uniref:sulfatase-like hydrolase/transferase n=1 Tax=Eudoraea algarum TaxID=3417568 RepID=UPI003D362114
MQVEKQAHKRLEKKTLRDFIRLVFAFFFSLAVLSVYQQLRLYSNGVLDSFLNKSLLLLWLHQLGFTAVISLVLAFLFNFVEGRKAKFGFRLVGGILLLSLVLETLLIEYYVRNYEILGADILGTSSAGQVGPYLLIALVALLALLPLFYLFYRISKSFYHVISSMYPFTIVLFGLFLATLTSNRRPINENKIQHLAGSIASNLFDFNKYEGAVEYPLLKPHVQKDVLGKYLELPNEKPNIVILVMEGIGSDFVGPKARYPGFTAFLDSMATQSLYWSNYVSNTGESAAAIPTLIGSLPFGRNGFTYAERSPGRNTLFSILKKNGYTTTFNYGGNSALQHLDRFVDEERVDFVVDKNGFGDKYSLMDKDAAGISLGYPDQALFKKWNAERILDNKPRLDVFLTLSTKKPYLIPNRGHYIAQVEKHMAQTPLPKRSKKLITKNKEMFASLIYADEALKTFFKDFSRHADYANTIFIITGSHNSTDLPQVDDLGRYRAPLMIYSPLLKAPKTVNSLASHADVLPSVVALLHEKYDLKFPDREAWLGESLISENVFDSSKAIPLFRGQNNIQDYIYGKHLLSRGTLYGLTTELALSEVDDTGIKKDLAEQFKSFRAINTYVVENNKLMPDSLNLFKRATMEFAKEDMVWINSVFNGNDFDKAYASARKLALNHENDRALLLCHYILAKVPGHADTQILMGRIHAWQGKYDIAIEILKEAIRKYPTYADGYAALLDVYFWSDQDTEAMILVEVIERNEIKSKEVAKKIARAYTRLKSNPENDLNTLRNPQNIENYLASL